MANFIYDKSEDINVLSLDSQYYVTYQGKLQIGKISKIHVNQSANIDGSIKIKTQIKYSFIMSDGNECTPGDENVYNSEADYLKGCKAGFYQSPLGYLERVLGLPYTKTTHLAPVSIHGYYCNDFVIEHFERKLPSNFVIDCSKDENVILGMDLPRKIYSNYEDALFENDTKIVGEDGTEHIVKSSASKFALSEEQQKLVNKLKGVFQELSDAGVSLIYEFQEDCLMAFNEIEGETGLSYDKYDTEANWDGWETADLRYAQEIPTIIRSVNIDCSNLKYKR